MISPGNFWYLENWSLRRGGSTVFSLLFKERNMENIKIFDKLKRINQARYNKL